MKKALITIAALLLAVGWLQAGDYHYSGNGSLFCNDCHIMHGSVSHTGPGYYSAPVTYNGGAGFDFLLKAATENELCLTCHDGAGYAPDVMNGPTSMINRSAGGLNDGSGTDGYAVGEGHTLGSTDVAPGGTFAGPLGCESCHDKHGWQGPGVGAGTIDDIGGNGYNAALGGYRNLQPRGKFGPSPIYVSYEVGAATNAADFYETAPASYATQYVNLQEPTQTDSGIATWCGSCHGDFHGADVTAAPYSAVAAGSGFDEFNKHPASTSNIGAVGGGHSSLADFSGHDYRVRVMNAGGTWPQGAPWAAAPTDLTPTCLSCHKAHGTSNAFGLIYFDGATDDPALVDSEDGTGTYITLCGQCHVQAG